MMRHKIPRFNAGRERIRSTIKKAEDGDIIEVHSNTVLEMAQIARQVQCPSKNLRFDVITTGKNTAKTTLADAWMKAIADAWMKAIADAWMKEIGDAWMKEIGESERGRSERG